MIIAAFLVLLFAVVPAVADDVTPQRSVNVTVVLNGADSAGDVQVLMKALRSVNGTKVITDSVGTGFRRFNNRFTTPIVVQVPMIPGDDDVNVGILAAAVSRAETNDPRKFPPGVNLVFFTDDAMNEASVSALRASLGSANGVEANQPGGIGGHLQDGWCWIRLENAGGAMLKDIEEKSRHAAVKYRRLKIEHLE